MISQESVNPVLVKNELNLLAINNLFVITLSPSLKNCEIDFFLLVLLSILIMVFQVPLMSSINILNIDS